MPTPLPLPLRTERLVARPWEPADRQDLLALLRPPETTRYLYSDPLDETTVDAALEQRCRIPPFDGDGQVLKLAAVRRADDAVVGDLTLILTNRDNAQGEIGYILAAEARGQGLATEGARALLDLGFGPLGLHRISAQCDARNAASARVMARLGMRQEAHLIENEFVKGEWTDELIFALLDREWAAGPAADGGLR